MLVMKYLVDSIISKQYSFKNLNTHENISNISPIIY